LKKKKRGERAKTEMRVRKQSWSINGRRTSAGEREGKGRGTKRALIFWVYFYLLWHRLMRHDEVAHVNLAGRGTRPRH